MFESWGLGGGRKGKISNNKSSTDISKMQLTTKLWKKMGLEDGNVWSAMYRISILKAVSHNKGTVQSNVL